MSWLVEVGAAHVQVLALGSLIDTVLPLNAVAGQLVTVNPCMSPLDTSHLGHLSQGSGLGCSATDAQNSIPVVWNRDTWL